MMLGNVKNNKVIGFVVLIAVLLCLGVYWAGALLGEESENRLYLASVVSSFNGRAAEFKKILATEKSGRDILSNPNHQFKGVDEIIFGRGGEVIVLSKEYNRIVVLRVNKNGRRLWDCETFPRVSFKSMCEM